MCLARTDWDVPKHRGPHLVRRKDGRARGRRAADPEINGDVEFCQEFLDDVEVAADDVIGEVNGGWTVARYMLAAERGGGERGVLGGDSARRRVRTGSRRAGPPVGRAHEPGVRQLVARRATSSTSSAPALLRRVLALGQAGEANPASIAAYAKLAEGTFAPERARLGLAIGGRGAVLWDEEAPGRRRRRPRLSERRAATASPAGPTR